MPSEKKKLSFRYIKFLYVQEGMNVMNLHFAETKASITRMGNTISLPNFFPMKTGFTSRLSDLTETIRDAIFY